MQKFKFLDEKGNEVPDPTPASIPAGFKVPESLQEQIKRLIRTSLSEQADEQGMETFEESEDFDIDDDMFDPSSPYEEVFDPVLNRGITLDEFNKNEAVYRERYLDAQQRAYQVMDTSNALRGIPKKDVPDRPLAKQSGSAPEAPNGQEEPVKGT